MKTYRKLIIVAIGILVISACKNETIDKIKKAKNDISNVSSIVSNAKEAQEESLKLKEITPMTNDELKTWLPENIENLSRTGFKVGKTGYMNVASIEGTFKAEDGHELKVEVIDGAGEMGSVLMTGIGMASKMEVEEENESKHLKTVTENGIKAKQTYYKKRGDTDLQFIYGKRYIVMILARNTEPEKAWEFVEQLNLENLIK